MLKNAFLVFIGGGMGSVLRFIATRYLNDFNFPFGTLMVNVLGSLILGIVLGLTLKSVSADNTTSLLFGIGFCGGFTTFSSFAVENQAFLRSGDYLNFGVYTLGSILLGVLAVFLGLLISKMV